MFCFCLMRGTEVRHVATLSASPVTFWLMSGSLSVKVMQASPTHKHPHITAGTTMQMCTQPQGDMNNRWSSYCDENRQKRSPDCLNCLNGSGCWTTSPACLYTSFLLTLTCEQRWRCAAAATSVLTLTCAFPWLQIRSHRLVLLSYV